MSLSVRGHAIHLVEVFRCGTFGSIGSLSVTWEALHAMMRSDAFDFEEMTRYHMSCPTGAWSERPMVTRTLLAEGTRCWGQEDGHGQAHVRAKFIVYEYPLAGW